MNRRYRAVHDVPSQCWRIFDDVTEKFLYSNPNGANGGWATEEDAEAAIVRKLEKASGETDDDDNLISDSDLRITQQRTEDFLKILKLLEGKVICSACGHKYTGNEVGTKFQPKEYLKVTGLSVNGLQLDATTTDVEADPQYKFIASLRCMLCDNTGVYIFKDNPFALPKMKNPCKEIDLRPRPSPLKEIDIVAEEINP
jgi:hypothetical protein